MTPAETSAVERRLELLERRAQVLMHLTKGALSLAAELMDKCKNDVDQNERILRVALVDLHQRLRALEEV